MQMLSVLFSASKSAVLDRSHHQLTFQATIFFKEKMSLANSMFGLLFVLLNFGGGLCGDEWPIWIDCPAGKDYESDNQFFNWAIRKTELPPNLYVSFERSLTDSSAHQNFSRSLNCDSSGSFKNLCSNEDSEKCVLGKTSLCVRPATAQHPLFENAVDIFAMHDYNCDGVGNQLYYALGLYQVKDGADTSNLPQNLETQFNLVSTSEIVARFYLFRFLPEMLGDGKKYFAVGFVYLKVALLSAVTGANVGRLPGNEWPKWVKCSEEIQEETYDWAIRQIEIPDHLLVQRNLSDLTGASFHQNFTRESACGSDINLCHPNKDVEKCVFHRTSLCVRKETVQSYLRGENSTFATHDYYCDGKGNQLYYSFGVFQISKYYVNNLSPNMEPEINLVSVSPNAQLINARFYLSHYLPRFRLSNDYYLAVGFVYLKVSVGTAVTSIVSKTAPGLSLQHYFK